MKGRIIGHGKKTRYILDGEDVTKAEFDAAFPDKPIVGSACPETINKTSKAWPRKSDALGVGAHQKAEAEELCRKLGVPTEFDASDGRANIRDNAHQRDLQKAFGYHNNDGGYGQVTG